jgi:hypothetical protein
MKPKEDWFQSHWKAAIAWQYFVVCLWDFMLAPLFMSWFSYATKTPPTVWVPLTTQAGGLYHLSMGAIVGVTSFSKSKEAIAVTNVNKPSEDDADRLPNG